MVSLHALLKLKNGFLIAIIVTINLICLLSVSLQNVITWRSPHQHIDDDPYNYSNIARVNAMTNTTVNMKLEIMKLELNDTKVTNDAMFPAKQIGRYIMVDADRCRGVKDLDIIIIVHTAPANMERRQRIRDTFGNEDLFVPFRVRTAFLLGKTLNRTLERMLWFEHATYNDTVMGDFIDDYHNLTLKGVMGYRWVSEHCNNSRFVLKIDDDVMINMYKLLYSFLNHMRGKSKSIFCNLWRKDTAHIMRQGKWKVEPHIFSKRKKFPYDYCSGFVVLMTTDLIGPMFDAAMTTPFFWIDDMYLFGMLPSVVGGVTYYNYALGLNITLNEQKAHECTRTQGPRCPIFASAVTDKGFWTYWDLIKGIYTQTNSWRVENKIVT